jgi:hypothetical protein
MPYVPVGWVDGVTPTNAANLNQMEDGIESLDALPKIPTPLVEGNWLKVQGGALVWAPIPAGTSVRRIPLALNVPRVSTLAGNAFWSVAAAGGWDSGRWEFVKDVEGRVYGTVFVPPTYDPAVTAKIILALAANAAAGVTRMQVATKAVADGESVAPGALTVEAAQDVIVPATAYLSKIVTFPLTEVLAANDLLIVEVTHLGAHANDTLAVSTLLYGAWFEVQA